MNINKKFVIIGIILLAAAWAGNILYYQMHILKEPLFTKHYYNILQAGQTFELYSIDNIASKNRIIGIVFPEIGPEYITYDERNGNSDNRYYRLNIINARLSDNPEAFDKYKNRAITKAEVHLSGGKVMNVDIGRIFISDSSFHAERELLQQTSAMGSSDNTGQYVYEAKADLKIQGISSEFPELIGDIADISINEVPLEETAFPISLKKGENLKVQYSFSFDEDSLKRSYAYNFPLYIAAEDSQGKNENSIAFVHYWLQFPECYDINALKIDRGIR